VERAKARGVFELERPFSCGGGDRRWSTVIEEAFEVVDSEMWASETSD
jgi:hypothetical protein